ncbi:MAG TPA: lysylphosphatidylglycerol synthase transmembrane domain-containing protein [Geminicoccus sp.]|jgi:uncharacterized protein (TIRG00374 family)|uniref:lysylphosphatidylglycerol synthase transmembrane domain-containing protein n=1 Tax=Geminicoccus sp. TaxID=2024832 RepID=UPI002E337830|nr:lysylphosphatidylglycerol synthase transmembrane domain-containing protein [Geminicoccus sp.]HEX2526488.1 lysylphosphatidylglycerol synthase transmembrane domain-containing protein [Geminicoccus sp.]
MSVHSSVAADAELQAQRSQAGRWIGFGIAAAALMVVIAFYVGSDEVLAYAHRLTPELIAVLLGLSLVNYAMRAWRWDVYARQRRVRIPFLRHSLYYVAGFALTVTPGKLGELLRLWLMREGDGQPYARTLPLLVADRLADSLALLVMACVGIVTLQGGLMSAIIPAAVFILGSWWLGTRPRLIMGAVFSVQRRLGRGRSSVRKLHRLACEVAHLLRSGPFLFGLVLSLLGWFAEAAALWWLLHSLDADLPLFIVVFIFAASMLAGAAAMLPGGLGGAEISMVALLVAFGVASEPGIIATALIRLTTLWFAVGLGFLLLPVAMRVARQRR